MAIGNPWGAAAQSYGQDLDQLTKIQMGGMQQAAQMPLQLYDRFMDGYEKARQRAAQEKQLEMQQAQLDRQNRLADLKFQQDKEHQDYVIREDQRKRVMGGLKDVADTSGDLVDKYTPDARGVFKQRFRNAALAQGKSPEEADAFSESMMPSLKSTPVVSSVQPDNPDNAAFNAEADLPDAWSFSPGSSMEDTFKGRMVLRDEEIALKNKNEAEYKRGKEAQDKIENDRRLDQGDSRLAQGERRLDMMGQALMAKDKPKPGRVPPASAIKGISENEKYLAMINRAIEAVKKNPNAFGGKNFLPDDVIQRTDPGGVSARAAVAGVSAHVYHDISGAAVTVAEDKRLSPYAPKLHNPPKSILTKLQRLASEYGDTIKRSKELYSEENGFVGFKDRGGDGGGTKRFRVGKTTYNIPAREVDEFKRDNPTAQEL